jgi:serine/threonine protein kinase
LSSQITINNKFAVKKLLYAQNDKEFRNEVDALKRFNGFVHEHLVTLLMTWTRHGHYNFLFPLAGCNLEDFWRKHSPWEIRDIIDVPAVQWISKQVLGLAGAVDTVHNPSHHLGQDRKYGRHGDLKPENILWYQSPKHPRGILVIADLGLSSVNTEKSRSNIPNQGIPFTPGYRPPECDLEGGTISRSYDIWTFGCLLLELVSCALGGNKARVDFENKRMSPYITGSKSDIFFDVRRQDGGPDYVVMVKECVSQVSLVDSSRYESILIITSGSLHCMR